MASAKPRGAFVVFEGVDRAGKTTQAKILSDALSAEGRRVRHQRFPDRTTTIGQMINQYMQNNSDLEDHVIHLLFSANRWELSESIKSDIENGTIVICDRYIYSGMIYSAAKNNAELSMSWAREPDVGLPRPDLLLFLDLEPAESERRAGFGAERYENRKMQDDVRNLYHILKAHGGEDAEDLVVIDAGRSVEEVGHDIAQVVQTKLNEVEGSGQDLRRIGKWSTECAKAVDLASQQKLALGNR